MGQTDNKTTPATRPKSQKTAPAPAATAAKGNEIVVHASEEKKKRRLRRDTLAVRKIVGYQRHTGNMIQKAKALRLVRAVAQAQCEDMKFQRQAVEKLLAANEKAVKVLFAKALVVCRRSKHEIVTGEDIRAVYEVADYRQMLGLTVDAGADVDANPDADELMHVPEAFVQKPRSRAPVAITN